MATVFSKIIIGEIPSYKIAEDDKHYAFLDINPIVKGHTLVIPKREVDYIFDLTGEELAALTVCAKRVSESLKKNIDCNRVAMMVLGLEVPHAHIHLLPINKESDVNIKNRVSFSPEEMTSIAELIRDHGKQ